MSHYLRRLVCSAFLLNVSASSIFATNYIVNVGTDASVSTGGDGTSTTGDFRYVLNQILNEQAQSLSSPPHTITFTTPSVTLTALPPPINLFQADTIIIGNSGGSPTIIDGGSLYRPFFIRQGDVTLQNMTIQNGLAQGGSGGAVGGGGGMGAGGALFVDAATVNISNVTFSSNAASAGLVGGSSGFMGAGGGGGGLGGNANVVSGGGGYSGQGGPLGGGGGVADGSEGNLSPTLTGGGGGAIIGANGGNSASGDTGNGSPGGSVSGYVFGGGGGQGGDTSGNGGDGGGTTPGIGNASGCGGGGGYLGSAATGGAGGAGGIGGGGGAGIFGQPAPGGIGGDGGGGGGNEGNGGYCGGGGVINGTGGFGGGGGGLLGGNAGFGGGGGSSSSSSGSPGGNGGFGGGAGGGGGSTGGDPGTPGVGASVAYSTSIGGDGAAFGGAIFVNTGTVRFLGNVSTTGNSVTANTGNGAAVGTDLFAISGSSVTFSPASDETITVSGVIADDSPTSVPGGFTWQPGTGSGAAVSISGSGNVIFEGANTYIGDTTVSSGTLSINNQISGGVTVTSGGTLKGTGTIYGGGSISGTLSPGNSIGTLTFDTSDGNLTLESSSITNIEIDSTTSSQVLITGTGQIILGGTVHITQEVDSYSMNQKYPIVQGPYSGEFNSKVTGGLPGYAFHLSYLPPYVYLGFGASAISTSGLSGNALTLANYLNNNASSATLALLDSLGENALNNALDAISPSRNAFGTYITEETAFSLSILLSNHLNALHVSQGTPSKNNELLGLLVDASDTVKKPVKSNQRNKFSVWASGFGEYSHQSAKQQNPSFHYISGAALTGIDYFLDRNATLGGALGYAHTHFKSRENESHGNVNYYFASLYGNFMTGKFYFAPAIWGLFDQIHNIRNISFKGFSKTANAHIFAWQLLPHLEVGYDFAMNWGTIAPFTSADWAISWQRGYQEWGAAPFNAKQKANNSSMVRSETGLRFSENWEKDWGAFLLKEKLSYVFEKPYGTGVVTSSFAGTPGSFTVTAVNQNLNLGAFGLNFLAAMGKQKPVTLDLGYEGEFGVNYWSNQLMLTIKKDF